MKMAKTKRQKEKQGQKPSAAGRKARRDIPLALLLGVALVVLGACGGVEPEKRAYPLAISVDYREGAYEVLYGMADLPVLTGQDKSGEGTEEEGDAGGKEAALRGKHLEEIAVQYDKSQECELDTGHVQAILFGENLLADQEAFGEVMEYLEGDRSLGRQALVFSAENPGEVMGMNGKEIDSIGKYLKGIYENRETPREKPVTLDEVYYVWYNKGNLPELPGIQRMGDGVLVD